MRDAPGRGVAGVGRGAAIRAFVQAASVFAEQEGRQYVTSVSNADHYIDALTLITHSDVPDFVDTTLPAFWDERIATATADLSSRKAALTVWAWVGLSSRE